MQTLLWHMKAFSSQVLLGAKENAAHKKKKKERNWEQSDKQLIFLHEDETRSEFEGIQWK